MWVLLAACDRGAHGAPGAGASVSVALSQVVPAAVASVSAAPPPATPASSAGYAALVRAERWAEARAALDALPETERAQPEVRFVRARVALELDDAAAALPLLDGLHTALPQLAPQIAEARARAQLRVGPFAEAARYFEQRADNESLFSAALAYQQDSALAKARLALDRVLARLGKSKRTRSVEVRARALRASLASEMGDKGTAIADYRWLALAAPLRSEADLALAVLDAVPATRLSKTEHLDRATKLAEAGRVDATEAELALVAKAPGAPVPIGRLTYLRAFALYAARQSYAKAAELFERAAREDPENAPRALFFAARALSRAQLDERAIAGYERVARQFPKTDWAEQAQYLSARLRFIAGEYVKARGLYDRYLAAFGKHARFGNDASYERGLCALETDQPLSAAPGFARLAALSKDRRSRARLRYLEALSYALGNQKEKAVQVFTEVARNEPLSFFGLAARGRLGIVGAPQPALIAEPGSSAVTNASAHAPLALTLPGDVAVLGRVGLARDAERLLSQQESSFSRGYAPRGSEALCEAYGMLGVGQRRYRLAQEVVRAEALDVAPTAANSWAWDCIYPTPYQDLVLAAAARENLSPALIFAVMRQESVFDPSAGSGAGAAGLLQLIAPTARRVAEQLKEPFSEASLLSPDSNIRYGAHYLAQLSDYFEGNLALVAAAYNAGPEAVFRWLSAPEKIGMDAFVARIPFDETRTYVERVLGNLARYQYLSGGAAAVSALNLDLPRASTRPDDVF
ncbi:MAG TPA: transglycosylase SLT domain-containing protein [Polyangiaceae bacterium]|nr:transglycosylase SLT domain-containing protein [Polyangiaceae bacterium]